MKKVLLVSLFIMFCAVAVVVADPGDISSDLAILDGATNVKIEKFIISVRFQTATIVYRRYNGAVPVSGNSGKFKVKFVNTPDNPLTEGVDETDNKFNELMTYIEGGVLRDRLTIAAKIQLGIN